jgi:hypothetical protein
MAGVRMGTVADLGYMIMADATFWCNTDPLTLIFTAKANFFCDPATAPPPGQGDINGSVFLEYDSSQDLFRATATANANFPAGGNLVSASGGADLLWSPAEKHFYLGGPPGATRDQWVNVSVLGAISASGQLGIQDTASIANQVLCYASMHLEGDFAGIASGEIDGSGQVIFTKSPSGLGSVSLSAHASGDVDLSILGVGIVTGHGEGDVQATLPGDGHLHLSGTLSGTADGFVTGFIDLSGSADISFTVPP